jgi:hypothetical protein
MPAPTPSQIQTALTQAFINAGFMAQAYVDGAAVPVQPPQVTPAAAKLIKALASGDGAWFAAWQAAQIVSIPVTSAQGTPSAGVLP